MSQESAEITFADVDASLSRCMAENPPSGEEFALHKDAARMANLWAEMVCSGIKTRTRALVDERILAAVSAWQPKG